MAGQGQAARRRVGDLRLDRVERADERGHERGGREVVDLERRPDLLDPALAHDHDPVGQLERLLLVVGHVDGGDARAGAGSRGSRGAARRGSWRRARTGARRGAAPGGSIASARASATRCCCPPESCHGIAVAAALQVDHPEQLVDASRDLASLGRLRILSPKPTLAATVMFGNSAYDWKTMPTLRWFGARSVMSSPSMLDGARRSAARSPRSSAGSSSCRSPTGRGTTRTRRAPRARSKSCTASDVAEPLLDPGQFKEGHRTVRTS